MLHFGICIRVQFPKSQKLVRTSLKQFAILNGNLHSTNTKNSHKEEEKHKRIADFLFAKRKHLLIISLLLLSQLQRSQPLISGKLRFSPRKILLENEGDLYFVRPFSVKSGYVHGDLVRARITRKKSSDKLPEVEILSLIERT